jgi:hypothetical protein
MFEDFSHQQITPADVLGVVLLTGNSSPMVFEPLSQSWSSLTPEITAPVTGAAFDPVSLSWIIAASNGSVYTYDALTDSLIEQVAAPPGTLGMPAVDSRAGRVSFPTTFGYLAVYSLPNLIPVGLSPFAIGGTPQQALFDERGRRVFLSDPAVSGTRVVDDTYFSGLAGGSLVGVGTPADIAKDITSNRFFASYPDDGLVRSYVLDTLQPAIPPAVALSSPTHVETHSDSVVVLTSTGQLHLLDILGFTPQQPPVSTGASGGVLGILKSRVPSVVLNEVKGNGAGWVELYITETTNLAGWVLETTSDSLQIDLSSLGSVNSGSYVLICHPNVELGEACDLETPALFLESSAILELRNVGLRVDYLVTPTGGDVFARRHPSIDGRRNEAYASSAGTPGFSNDDVGLP